jgi:hypothetical protein
VGEKAGRDAGPAQIDRTEDARDAVFRQRSSVASMSDWRLLAADALQ